jgi:outer membrane biosynthesis protein TonB
MVFAHLRREERIGLGIAVALHVGLAGAFLVQSTNREPVPSVEKMTVSLATDVGLEATAPEPVPESAAAIAPTLAQEPAPPQPAEPIVQPLPEPPRPAPVPRATAAPRPQPTRASAAPRRRPDAPASRANATPRPAGGSRIGADFLPGAGESTTTRETRVPANQIGASAKASLVQAIAREIKPKWAPPDGPEVNEITTFLRFRLNPDGSLAGRPELIRQTGVNDVNRAQAGRHAEQAIRAVQLAAPFDLPEEYYEAWKLVSPFSFDWKLSQ